MPSFCREIQNAILPKLRDALLGQTIQLDKAHVKVIEITDDKCDNNPILIATLDFEDGDTMAEKIIIEVNRLDA